MKSSMSFPISLSANAVMTPVFILKHFLKPRTTLYSPPPSHALKDLAVLILPSPGSRRSITSPNETASYLHSLFGFKLRFMVLYSPLLSDTVCKLYSFLCHLLYLVKLSGLYHIALYHPASATADNLVTA